MILGIKDGNTAYCFKFKYDGNLRTREKKTLFAEQTVVDRANSWLLDCYCLVACCIRDITKNQEI